MKRAIAVCMATIIAQMAALISIVPVDAQPNERSRQRQAAEQVLEQLATDAGGLTLEEIEHLSDLGPNPWLSYTADRDPAAVAAWLAIAEQLPPEAQVPNGKAQIGGPPISHTESEQVGEVGLNDTAETGESIDRFGTKPGDKGVVTINGALSGGQVRSPLPSDCESVEDDGSITQANFTPAVRKEIALCIGVAGDGPYGESSGDVDFFSYGRVTEGHTIALDAIHLSDTLDPANTIIGIYDEDGNLLMSTEDPGGVDGAPDPFLTMTAPATGQYYGAVAGCCELPSDPFDSSSVTGVGDKGTYEVFLVTFAPPCTSQEDDGAIALANTTNAPIRRFDSCAGEIGNGPHGSSDSDFYDLGIVEVGFDLYLDVSAPNGLFDSVVGLYNDDGELIASFEDNGSRDPADPNLFLNFPIQETDHYYAAISGCCDLPSDPTDPASGTPSDQSGRYQLIIDIQRPPLPCNSVEDDGSIPTAHPNEVPYGEATFAAECFGQIGDGPHAQTNGDVDFFRTRQLPAGRALIVDFVDFGPPTNAGDLTIGVYDSDGNLMATGQDDPTRGGVDANPFSVIVPEDGVYYVALGGALPTDPFDSSTGTNTDIVSPYVGVIIVDTNADDLVQGLTNWLGGPDPDRDYSLTWEETLARVRSTIDQASATVEPSEVVEEPVDIDYFLVNLRQGDAISGGFDDARSVGILDPSGVQRSGSKFNASFIYPAESPLRHDRRNGFDHVATVDGVHAVFVTDGLGAYEGELRVVRSGLAPDRDRDQQILFLDFDGAVIAGDIWGAGPDPDLSPLAAFMDRWGLDASEEDAVIDATIDAIIESLDHDLRVLDGRNGDRDSSYKGPEFDLKVLNSRDHADAWGEPNVSRIVIGGTIAQLGIPTIGIAQSIDPGNTETEETAVILLDLVSDAAGARSSINSFAVADGTTKAEFVGFAVGHVAAHEIGHLIGNFHQETSNEVQALMDSGGDFPAIAGVGPDHVFGTADDTDPDFIEDVFSFGEGYNGIEDTAGRSAFAFSTGQLPVAGPR